MADIIYNGARVIEYAKSRKGQSEATAVTWSCSPEFDATRSTEVSFVEDGAFTAIPRPIPRSGSKYVTPKASFHRVNYTRTRTLRESRVSFVQEYIFRDISLTNQINSYSN